MVDTAPSQDAASTGGRNTALISIGYGLHMTWVSCLFYQGMLPATVGNAPAYYQFFLASMSVLVMSLVAFGFYANKSQRQETFTRKSLSIVFAALMCVGTLACTEIGLDTFPKIILFIVSALATGIGSAWYNAAWGLQMTRLLSIDTVVALCGSYVLSAFLYLTV